MKICSRCKISKAFSEFHVNKATKDRHQTECKSCALARIKARSEHYQKNLQHIKNKTCKACKKNFSVENFFKSKATKDGYGIYCKICQKRRNLIYRYNISENDFNLMAKNGCEVCGSFESLVIDHNHNCCQSANSCGKCVRGVLCSKCNMAEGLLGSDIKKIKSLLEYVAKHG